GWNFGYRMLVDAAPILVLALLPVMTWLSSRPLARSLFIATALLAFVIHGIGAYCYSPRDWDGRPDVDVHRERLWSVGDSQLVYWMTHARLREPPL
ncbi:MAG: hypothetical protein ACXVAN_00670, partial [Polyangia bacterium]